MILKKCIKCVLPENYPGIRFNKDGVCNYCLTNKKVQSKGKDRFEKILNTYRNDKKKYDCIVGVSGGRDSSYTLYYLVKKCNLRVLAYSADNGFVPEQSKINMKKMTDILHVKLVVEKHKYLKKCIRHNISSWLKRPSPAMVPMICCGCRLGIFRGLLKCAKAFGIPIVITGSGNSIEASRFKKTFMTSNSFGKKLKMKKSKNFSFVLGFIYEFMKNPLFFLKPINSIIYLKEYLYCFHSNMIRKIFYPNQKTLRFFQFINWNENVVLSTIKNELNWKISKDSASSWRSDCLISILKNYALKKSAGFTEKDEMYSHMIRKGMIRREDALNRLERENMTPKNLIHEIIDNIIN